MPADALERFGDDWSSLVGEELIARLNSRADELQVTASALKWRLAALGQLKPAAARSLPEAALRNNGRDPAEIVPPVLFSKPFAEVIGLAITGGHVSIRRVAGLLDLAIEDLMALFTTHDVERPVDL